MSHYSGTCEYLPTIIFTWVYLSVMYTSLTAYEHRVSMSFMVILNVPPSEMYLYVVGEV